MKRIVYAAGLVFALFELVAVLGQAATYQPRNLGFVTFSFATHTVTEISATTAPTVGYALWCTNCSVGAGNGALCVSSTTVAPGAGSDFILSTGTVCK